MLFASLQTIDREYSTKYLLPNMTGFYQNISIMSGSDDPIPCKLFDSFNGVARITDGWSLFVQQQMPEVDCECVLRFERNGTTLTVICYFI